MIHHGQNIGSRVGAVLLMLLTMAAIVFAIINFQQRLSFDVPDDGISWSDSDQGVQAIFVAPRSPGEAAGMKSGDVLVSINGQLGIRYMVAGPLPDPAAEPQFRYQRNNCARS